jgi:hypothetical protein
MPNQPDAHIAALERERDHISVTLGQAQSDLVGLRGRLATAERESDELRQWKSSQQQALIKMSVLLLEAGCRTDGVIDGMKILISERDELRKRVEELEWRFLVASRGLRWCLGRHLPIEVTQRIQTMLGLLTQPLHSTPPAAQGAQP